MALNVPTITIVDDGDGTGATVTVSGSTSGSTNTFRAGKLVGGQLTLLANSGSRTGDGSISATLSVGHWIGLVTSSKQGESSVESNVETFPVTSTGDVLHVRIMQAVGTKIASLNLTGLDPERIYVNMLADMLNATFPCVFVTLDMTTEAWNLATNIRDDVAYPVLVMVVVRASRDLATTGAQLLGWRHDIRQAFRNQGLPAVSEVHKTGVSYQPIVPREVKGFLLLLSGLQLQFSVRE